MNTGNNRAKAQGTRSRTTTRLKDAVNRAAARLDAESEHLIAYVNDEVVPAIRKGSSRGLRKAAEELSKFADHLDSTRSR